MHIFEPFPLKNDDFYKKIGRGVAAVLDFAPFLFFLFAAVAAAILVKIK